MKTISIEVPNLFGDHHVIEIRNLLSGIPGVVDVYASSCFQVVEVTYDPDIVNDLEISIKLDQAGYLSEWSLPVEPNTSTYNKEGMKPFFRHTSVFETVRQTVGFSQNVPYSGRPLWNCPGMGVIRNVMED